MSYAPPPVGLNMLENLATEFVTTLSGNGGSITATATSFNVAANLPSGLTPPFRAVLYAAGASTGEIVLVGAVAGTAWSSVSRGQEQTLGAPAATAHNDGDNVACVLTAQGLQNILAGNVTVVPGLKADCVLLTDANITAAANVLSSASASFTAADVGKLAGC